MQASRVALNVLVVGIDTIKRKNLYQMDGLRPFGASFLVITPDSLGKAKAVAEGSPNVAIVVTSSRWPRLSMMLSTARAAFSGAYQVAELYPGSVLQLLCAAILKVARVKILIVARGEEYWYVTGRMSKLRRLAFRLTYALADAVLYKELYMEQMLGDLGIKVRRLLPNAVAVPADYPPAPKNGCTFLYLNTFKFFRHPELAVSAFSRLCDELTLDPDGPTRLILVGAPDDTAGEDAQRKLAAVKELLQGRRMPVDIHPWTNDPYAWIAKANVFLLPADVVFVNYTLLEAMARERPAIIQRSPGADMLISHGHDGLIADRSTDSWYAAMREMLLSRETREQMGREARRKVVSQFGYEHYLEQYLDLYRNVLAQ